MDRIGICFKRNSRGSQLRDHSRGRSSIQPSSFAVRGYFSRGFLPLGSNVIGGLSRAEFLNVPVVINDEGRHVIMFTVLPFRLAGPDQASIGDPCLWV